jgi:hypothetical protein
VVGPWSPHCTCGFCCGQAEVRHLLTDAAAEKITRGSLKAAVDHALNAQTIVVLDSLNYIKGFRYELYCSARQESTPHCVVSCQPPPIAPVPKRVQGSGFSMNHHGRVDPHLPPSLVPQVWVESDVERSREWNAAREDAYPPQLCVHSQDHLTHLYSQQRFSLVPAGAESGEEASH